MCKLPTQMMEVELEKVLQKQKQLQEEHKRKAIELLRAMESRISSVSTISHISIGILYSKK